ncbi:Uncharacterized protein HZ326_20959 [Fusarium oxysporum f. sp. albedinis]|nr:Uncharacterized protein HZ326_20959 [Fusarium oxysporum f. sp. albedinis]
MLNARFFRIRLHVEIEVDCWNLFYRCGYDELMRNLRSKGGLLGISNTFLREKQLSRRGLVLFPNVVHQELLVHSMRRWCMGTLRGCAQYNDILLREATQ